MPLSDVKIGMVGEAYTISQDTETSDHVLCGAQVITVNVGQTRQKLVCRLSINSHLG